MSSHTHDLGVESVEVEPGVGTGIFVLTNATVVSPTTTGPRCFTVVWVMRVR